MKIIYNNHRSLIILLLISLLMSACSKSFIDREPADALPDNEALNSESSLQAAVNGLYANYRSVSVYGRHLTVIGDLMADNTFVETRNSGRYLPQYNYGVTSSDGTATEIWAGEVQSDGTVLNPGLYSVILRANRIIDANVSGGTVPQLKAEAYALRALAYFKLVTYYAKPYTDDPSALGVPIVLHYDPFALPKRDTVEKVYTQIISDLQKSLETDIPFTTSVKLNSAAVKALLAKVYLYKGDMTNALINAEDVINNSGFILIPPANYVTYWNDPGIKLTQVETLFEIDDDQVNNNGTDELGAIYYEGYQDIYASRQLYDLYSSTDVRKGVMEEGATKNGISAIVVKKYINGNAGDRDNLKVVRLSEVYLIAAEAAAATNEDQARTYLNTLMKQRDPSFAGYTSTGSTLVDDIVNERRKELAFEGDRFFDLNRLKRPINRMDNPGSIPAGTGNVNLSIPYPDDRRVAPIPQREMQSNPNLKGQQNPGYN